MGFGLWLELLESPWAYGGGGRCLRGDIAGQAALGSSFECLYDVV